MNFSLKRAQAIMVKDYKEFSRNYAISIIMIVPIIFALLLRTAGPALPGAISLLLNNSLVILTCLVQACLIAEEKERNTLRSLMLTPATTIDVLIGKSTLVFIISAVILTISTFIMSYKPASIWAFSVALLLSIILYTAVGTICGLFSKTLLEASLYILPAGLIFTAPSIVTLLYGDSSLLYKILEYTPSVQFMYLLGVGNDGDWTTGALLKPLSIILIWTVILIILSVALYHRRLKDE